MGSSGVCNSPSTAFGGGFGHRVSGKCREKCKCIRRKVAGDGGRQAEGGSRKRTRSVRGGKATAYFLRSASSLIALAICSGVARESPLLVKTCVLPETEPWPS